MYRGRTFSLSFPPFTPWIKRIVIASAAIYFLQLLLHAAAPVIESEMVLYGALVPTLVLHGMLWQLVTYSLLHGGVWHLAINMLSLWMFGSQVEMDWGSRKFLEFYLFSVVGAALFTIAVAYAHLLGMTPESYTIGASGGVYGVLAAFGVLYGDREVFLFPFPISIKAKYLIWIIVFLVLLATLQPSQGGIANFAHLGGLVCGFLYVKLLARRRGPVFQASEKYFSLRNRYYRWKRRRAARKFEVYMRGHNRTVSFDEHGNYIPPEDRDKHNGGSKSGWVH